MEACKLPTKHLTEHCSRTDSQYDSGLISSILRFVTFSNNNSFIDATWNAVELIIWTIAEPGIYLIAACLITLRPLLDKYGPKVWPHATKAPHSDGKAGSSEVIRSKQFGTSHNKMASRIPTHLSGDNFMISGERGISLSSIRARGDGFEHLLDPEENLHGGQPPQTSNNGIRKTVDIGLSWEQVTPPP